MKTVFIDGSAGTTGLRIRERLAGRSDLRLLSLPEELRKDTEQRRRLLNSADYVFLCLPDDAAREAVSLIENPETVVLDTSTAHRTAPGWVYGFPELSPGLREKLLASRRIAVPGCHASGFIALVRPLVEAGLLPAGAQLSCHSLTGYSGGGKKMIGEYEAQGRSSLLDSPRLYSLGCSHKHIKEMQALTGLEQAPIFSPIVSDFYSGMLVTVPLFAEQLRKGATAEAVKQLYVKQYSGPIVRYAEQDEGGYYSAGGLSGLDRMDVAVYGNEKQLLLTARYDNLGKGASGAAIECLNLKLGTEPSTGLTLSE